LDEVEKQNEIALRVGTLAHNAASSHVLMLVWGKVAAL
jgi:hypothetical protein